MIVHLDVICGNVWILSKKLVQRRKHSENERMSLPPIRSLSRRPLRRNNSLRTHYFTNTSLQKLMGSWRMPAGSCAALKHGFGFDELYVVRTAPQKTDVLGDETSDKRAQLLE